jgi:hypothetical protein
VNLLKGLFDSVLIIAFLAFVAIFIRSLAQAGKRVARGESWTGDEDQPERILDVSSR